MATEEGPRMTKLRQVLKKATNASFKRLPPKKWAEIFSFINDTNPQVIERLNSEIQELLYSAVEEEFEIVCHENNVIEKLNLIDHLLLNQKSLDQIINNVDELEEEDFGDIYEPTNPQLQTKDLLIKLKEEEVERLKKVLEAQQEEKKKLLSEITQKQQKLTEFEKVFIHKASALSDAIHHLPTTDKMEI